MEKFFIMKDIDKCSGLPFDKKLIDFSALVVNLRLEGQDSRADMVQYLINRCERAESGR